MNPSVTWYFSRALGVIGLFAGVARVAVAVIMGEGTGELMGAVGTGILLAVGGLLGGAIVDVVVQVRKRARPRDPHRGRLHRKR